MIGFGEKGDFFSVRLNIHFVSCIHSLMNYYGICEDERE